MVSKQDGVSPRTPSELELKHNFGKKFSEVMGYAADAQKAAETAQEAANRANQALDGLDQDAVFNILTNNGEEQGIYRKDGKIYINASYIKSGTIIVEAEAFFEPGMEEVERIQAHISGVTIPESDLWLYDFNEDGVITSSDAVMVKRSIQGIKAVGDTWSRKQNSVITVSITPSDPIKTVCISGTNMWGRKVEIFLGANPQFSVFATKDYVTEAISNALTTLAE